MARLERIAPECFPILFFVFFSLIVTLIVLQDGVRQNLQHYSSHHFSTVSMFSTSSPFFSFESNVEDERVAVNDLLIWCLEMGSRLDADKIMPPSPRLRSPPVNASGLRRLPYRYTDWKSSPLLPRRATQCEHSLLMRLLIIIERICRKHHLTFFMSDGTLLGSWRHHDIIPWDEDVDLLMPIEHRSTFIKALDQLNDTLVQGYKKGNTKTDSYYFKVFFKHTPSVGGYTWKFPFVDIFFYFTNNTHLWYTINPIDNMQLKYVFPLVMRPFGYLWLPAPREPQNLFPSDVENQCHDHSYDHRNERLQKRVKLNCSVLADVYPFVQRHNQTKSIEILTINDTIIHTVVYPH